MDSIDIQQSYWDSVAEEKNFTHPFFLNLLKDFLFSNEFILDYGCGYGRVCKEIVDSGYKKIVGVDISSRMITRGKRLYPNINFLHVDGKKLPFPDQSFAACTLFAVLTCVPTDSGQKQLVEEIQRVLIPGGLLYISDYPLQADDKNQKRYNQYEKEFGAYGIFQLQDNGIVRHHHMSWIAELLSTFQIKKEKKITVSTMNGNSADAFQIVAKKI